MDQHDINLKHKPDPASRAAAHRKGQKKINEKKYFEGGQDKDLRQTKKKKKK